MSGRLPDDKIAYKLSGGVLRLESANGKHPAFWCGIDLEKVSRMKDMDDFDEEAGLGKPVSGRLPEDNIAYKLSGGVLRLESANGKHPEFWCQVYIFDFRYFMQTKWL